MEALQKVLLGLPAAEALTYWPGQEEDMDTSGSFADVLSGLPESLEELLALIKDGHLKQEEVDTAATVLQEQGLVVRNTQSGLERLVLDRGNWLSEAALPLLIDFFLSCSFGTSKVRPKKKYAAYSKEAERQHIAFGKKQAMRYYLLSILASR